MKKVLILLMGIVLLQACSSPESVAEKALHEIGDGKYKKDMIGVNLNKTSMNEKLFTDAYIDSQLGEEFSKYEAVGYLGNLSLSELDDVFFQTEILFDNIKIVDKKESKMDLYVFYRRHSDSEEDINVFKILESLNSSELKYFKSNGYCMAGLKYENVPCYELKYKVDNSRMVTVRVLKIPHTGYRVGSVMFE